MISWKQWLMGCIICILLVISMMPVEPRWAEADVVLSKLLPWMCLTMIMICVLRIGYMEFKAQDWAIVIWGIYYLGRLWIGAEYPCATEFLKTVCILVLYFVLRVLFDFWRPSSRWIVMVIIVFGIYEAGYGTWQLLMSSSRNFRYPLTGSFFNPGPYSASLMIAAVCCISWYIEARNRKMRKYLVLCIGLLGMLLPATMSRAAFAAMGFATFLLFRKKLSRMGLIGKIALCIGLLGAGLGLYFIKQGSADGRLLMWMASLTSWWNQPWIGVGIGGFHNASAEGMKFLYEKMQDCNLFSSGGVADYACNDMVLILTEQGLIGTMLCGYVVFLCLWEMYKQCKPLFYGFLSLLIFSLFSYPFEMLPYRIITVIVMAWISSNNDHDMVQINRYGWAICMAVLGGLSFFVENQIDVRNKADKAAAQLSGIHHDAFIKDYYELLSMELDNPQYLFDFAKTLNESHRFNDSNDMLRRGIQVSADPMFYVVMGNNYRDMKMYGQAETAYRMAYATMPNRLYPLYQLMKLYETMGDTAQLRIMAEKVLDFKEKIPSPATREMKMDGESIFHKIKKKQ